MSAKGSCVFVHQITSQSCLLDNAKLAYRILCGLGTATAMAAWVGASSVMMSSAAMFLAVVSRSKHECQISCHTGEVCLIICELEGELF